jgi:drug/metabolite transporter (DMT)-like permease
MRGDKLVSMALLVMGAGLLALPTLPFMPPLPVAAWPYVVASALIHLGYNTCLALSYHHGELGKVYPLVRGSAPLTTLIVSLIFMSEAVDASGVAGVILLAAGIMTLALDRGWRAIVASPQGLAYAAATSLCITGYTLCDGIGARVAGNAHPYVAWLFVIDTFPTVAFVYAVRRRAFVAAVRENWVAGFVGGGLSLVAYWIVIWAFTVAPIPIVAALRETSILFAALIGMIFLGEKMTPVRGLSIVMVLAGLVLMRL